MKVSFDHSLAVALLIPVLLMAGLGYLSWKGLEKLRATQDWVDHTQVVINQLQTVLIEVERASTATRGYLLTGDTNYVLTLQRVRATLPLEIDAVKKLTFDNDKRQQQLRTLESLVLAHLDKLQELVETNKRLPHSVITSDLEASNTLLNQIDGSVTSLQREERSLLSIRYQAANRSLEMAQSIFIAAFVCGLVVVGVSGSLFSHEMKTRRHLQVELQREAEQLQATNKELEAFTYSVSHDLRAPLRHIHGFVDLLQKSPALQTETASVRQMNIIGTAARQMGMLIDDLLAFSKTSRAEMHPITLPMSNLVDEAIKGQELDYAGRKIDWDVRPLCTVTADPSLLRLVWINLISNAVKYTRPRDEAHIEIGQVGPGEKGFSAREKVFYVRDNGVGFNMEYASKLFGVFQRLHRADEFEGTGIGLANVQRIVHRHGGRAWAESQLEVGSTFYFSLPT